MLTTVRPLASHTASEEAVQLFAREAQSVRLVRRFTAQTLSRWSITARVDDVTVCMSELATNALLHAVPPHGQFLVKLSLRGAALRAEVHDRSQHLPQIKRPSATSDDGRGLLLVRALADSWDSKIRKPNGKIVWAEFQLPGPTRL
ncbi:ATP-binding protein [Streptomyces sp. H10-C2]|uniref:ATP-binding protein n=1 Tax=unclassified Streptomyces TaxID=2593676 RepID=UPI0024BA5B6F|nr:MULTISPECIES: ATP-binding protein [unclassified Streptomyces]MDJ0345878.1 ATP-binding protein [Streptomyces sp. PH10-H1]MDJ0374727.1 ATP-binding protein [Streptomyces sp. H10-C2]